MRQTYHFVGDPRRMGDAVKDVFGFTPEDVNWLHGSFDEDSFSNGEHPLHLTRWWAHQPGISSVDEAHWVASTVYMTGPEMSDSPATFTTVTTSIQDPLIPIHPSPTEHTPPSRPLPQFDRHPEEKFWIRTVISNVPGHLDDTLMEDVRRKLERMYEYAFIRHQQIHLGTFPRSSQRRKRRVSSLNIRVQMVKSSMMKPDTMETIYYVLHEERPVLSSSAVHDLLLLGDEERIKHVSPYSLVLTEEYLHGNNGESEKRSWVIGAIVGGGFLSLLLIALLLFLIKYIKKSRPTRRESTQCIQNEQQVFEESHSGPVGTINLGFDPGESEDNKVVDSPSQHSEKKLLTGSTLGQRKRNGRGKRPTEHQWSSHERRGKGREEDEEEERMSEEIEGRGKRDEMKLSRGAIITDMEEEDVEKGSGREEEKFGRLKKKPGRPISAIIREASESPAPSVSFVDENVQIEPELHDAFTQPDSFILHGEADAHNEGCIDEGEEGIGKMKVKFHEILDDAFRMFTPQSSKGNRVSIASVEISREGITEGESISVPGIRAKSADVRVAFERPEKARPISAILRGDDRSSRHPTVPPPSPDSRDGGRSPIVPKSAWLGSGKGRPGSGIELRDPESGLHAFDPAIPVIRAIKRELQKFGPPDDSDKNM